jgi:type VII secretion-associated protein (TIGR03931 family)
MSTHHAVVEVGPGTIRGFCCGATKVVDDEVSAAALGAIDDAVALVGVRPVAVESLWREALRPLDCAGAATLSLVHPSWWPVPRVARVAAAARVLHGEIVVRPRSWLLALACETPEPPVVVEIAERLVAVIGGGVAAVPRRMPPHPGGETARRVAEMAGDAATVVIDAPSSVTGARDLAASIAGALRSAGATVVQLDDARLSRLARMAGATPSSDREPPAPATRVLRTGARRFAWVAAVGLTAAAAIPLTLPAGRPDVRSVERAPTTFLVEGRVALTVPSDWPIQRVIAGPGSARVQVTSPSDPEVALHVTQSVVPDETLAGTAERLKRAIDNEPPGVFVDFDPSATRAGRPAVTYREVRVAHRVAWTVLLDGAVRISLGCQSRPGGEDAVREVCEQAIRSAHAAS